VVVPANYLAQDQTVHAGEALAVQRASELARERGAKRVLPLAVSAPFHCSLMAPARDRLAADLGQASLQNLLVPLVTNVDAAEVRAADAARDALVRQVCLPVRWVETIEWLVRAGVDQFVEIGPGRVLTGLVRKIAPSAGTWNVEGMRGIEGLASLRPGATM
jgi:[acyl-carrier-protein] S-malonyltransferase